MEGKKKNPQPRVESASVLAERGEAGPTQRPGWGQGLGRRRSPAARAEACGEPTGVPSGAPQGLGCRAQRRCGRARDPHPPDARPPTNPGSCREPACCGRPAKGDETAKGVTGPSQTPSDPATSTAQADGLQQAAPPSSVRQERQRQARGGGRPSTPDPLRPTKVPPFSAVWRPVGNFGEGGPSHRTHSLPNLEPGQHMGVIVTHWS